jgi:hypothetical protein
VEAIPRDGFAVLNADDPLVARMRRVSLGEVIWFSMDPDNELVDAYVRRDGWAVTVQQTDKGEMIVIRHGPRTMPMALTHQLPSTFGGRARMNVENALAATAAAHAAGVHLHDIRRGLVTFTPSYSLAPGRLNLIRIRGVTVVIDYAHNPHGLRMLGDFVERMAETQPGEEVIAQRRVGVIAMPGDRRDEDLREFGEVAAAHFDLVIIREDANRRGRPPRRVGRGGGRGSPQGDGGSGRPLPEPGHRAGRAGGDRRGSRSCQSGGSAGDLRRPPGAGLGVPPATGGTGAHRARGVDGHSRFGARMSGYSPKSARQETLTRLCAGHRL